MSTDAAISAQGAAEDRIRRASARFVSYDPRTGRNAKGEKAPAKIRFQTQPTTDVSRERMRAMALGREAKRRADFATHCSKGHEWTEKNTITKRVTGVKVCRVCEAERGVQRRMLSARVSA